MKLRNLRRIAIAEIVAVHDWAVLNGIDLLVRYGEGALRREGERRWILEQLSEILRSAERAAYPVTFVTDGTQPGVNESLSERDKFFGDGMPCGGWPVTGRVADNGEPE